VSDCESEGGVAFGRSGLAKSVDDHHTIHTICLRTAGPTHHMDTARILYGNIIRELHDAIHDDEQLPKEPHEEKNPPNEHEKEHVQHPATSLPRCHVVHPSKCAC